VAEFSSFWRGLWLGFLIAAPVGPIGLLCIQRTLAGGMALGLVSGLGAASTDAIYGAVAAFGLVSVASFLTAASFWIRLLGSLFLLSLGLRIAFSRPAGQAVTTSRGNFWGAYGSTFLLTLSNPMTILSFVAVFAGLGLASTGSGYAGAGWTVVGVFCGSALWWLALCGGVSLLRRWVNASVLLWVNRVAGILLASFAIILLIGLWR
jgi:threonine/homoserine/homoserine lactone efflux protein